MCVRLHIDGLQRVGPLALSKRFKQSEVNVRLLCMILLVMVLRTTAAGQQLPGDAKTDREIRTQSEHYFDAIDRHDVKALDALLLDNCMICYPRGVTETKAALLKALHTPLADKPVQPAHTLSEMKVRRVGDTAILAVTLTATRVDEPGVIDNHRRTLVWIRQDGRWRLMNDQWSLVGDARLAEYWSVYFHGKNQNFKRKPNSLLVQAVKGRRPGKALDVGMGEGRNAIYLAKQGWKVTGIDRAGPPAMGPGCDPLCRRRSGQCGEDPRVAQTRRSAGHRGVPRETWGKGAWNRVRAR